MHIANIIRSMRGNRLAVDVHAFAILSEAGKMAILSIEKLPELTARQLVVLPVIGVRIKILPVQISSTRS